jgi:hypothetical protein
MAISHRRVKFDGGSMKRFLLLVMASFLAFALSVEAKPAPGYRWQSVTGDKVCAQISPGPDWVRLEITYVDARCQFRDNRATDSARAENRK